jgi:glyoxylase-like metal-dependent hydrolase (beta-lactamase superfamily II)
MAMINIQRFEVNPLQENCYVVSDDSRECVIIDCGAYYDEESIAIDNYLRKQQLKPVHLLATHGHLDHNFGNAHLFRQYGLKVEICAGDQQLVERLPQQAAALFGMEISDDQPPVGRLLNDGDTITFGQHTLQVIATPGHSHGSCLFYCKEEGVVFSGDTLFRMSIGRTDFPEGSWQQMEQSLAKIAGTLPKDTVVYPGHGPQTTIAEERQYNLYMRDTAI